MSELNTPLKISKQQESYIAGVTTVEDEHGLPVLDCFKVDADEIVKRINDYEDLERQLSELKAQNEKLREFTDKAVRAYCWGGSIDGGDIEEWALAAGIIKRVDFDSEIHDDDGIGLEAGDDFHVLADTHCLAEAQVDNKE